MPVCERPQIVRHGVLGERKVGQDSVFKHLICAKPNNWKHFLIFAHNGGGRRFSIQNSKKDRKNI